MNADSPLPGIYAVVPAAGVGRRMGAEKAKQYLSLDHSTVIEQTLARLLQVSRLEKIIVAIAEDDREWSKLAVASHPAVITVAGGEERMHSVLNGLDYLADFASEDDWVLVHDVARPCVEVADVERLLSHLSGHPVGGILAVPVSDTVKRVSGTVIRETLDRRQVWLAQTPQMFRLGLLRSALRHGVESGDMITDEASAIEQAGLYPEVVEGSRSNIKITHPDDLDLAEYYSARQLAENSKL